MEKNNYNEEALTYVLFGAEAIQLYDISVNMVLASEQLEYKVGAYNDLAAFIDESKKWDDFIEINENDYNALKKRLKERAVKSRGKSNKNGKPSFFNFFK